MSWSPISEEKVWDLIIAAEGRMSFAQQRLWNVIKVIPHKWSQEPWGNLGGGFWVVAVVGDSILWYNDIEDGFNISRYVAFGKIEEYWCNQDDLEHSVQQILALIESGSAPYKCGPPMPVGRA